MKSGTKNIILFLIFGALIGFVNGLFGGGAGIICVPILKAFLKLNDKEAHSTSILITAILSITTLIVYITNMELSFSNVPFICFGVLLGGLIGSNLLKKISNETLNIVFIIVMFLAGIKNLIF